MIREHSEQVVSSRPGDTFQFRVLSVTAVFGAREASTASGLSLRRQSRSRSSAHDDVDRRVHQMVDSELDAAHRPIRTWSVAHPRSCSASLLRSVGRQQIVR